MQLKKFFKNSKLSIDDKKLIIVVKKQIAGFEDDKENGKTIYKIIVNVKDK